MQSCVTEIDSPSWETEESTFAHPIKNASIHAGILNFFKSRSNL